MQIPLMRNVYEETKRILVWLGPANDVTKRALRILPNLTKIFEGIDPHTYMFDRNNLETFIPKGAPLPEDPIWALHWPPYGPSLLHVALDSPGSDSLKALYAAGSQAPTGTMFGIKGLMAVNAVNQMGPVDVTWLLPRVYVQFARYYIHEPRDCILNHVASAYRDQGLPSWCPDFSQPESAPQGSMTIGWVEMKPTSVSGPDGSILGSIAGSRYGARYRRSKVVDGEPGSKNPFTFAALAQTAAWESRYWGLAQRELGTTDGDMSSEYYRTMAANQIPGLGFAKIYDEHDAFPFANEYRG
ncbi:putative Heterokaryon incompatibility domain-containing protein [Seiridium unicorne]|uniref:Heterokaryon incompatibility domain-containing protein n=1 Tax=Seiridium unicorne TaxID=138068 RepID=A0ABR2V8P4_9PEZI